MSPKFSWDLPDVMNLFDEYIKSLAKATTKMDKSHVSSPYAASATTIANALRERYKDSRITRHTVRHQIDKRKKWLIAHGFDVATRISSKSKSPEEEGCSSSPSVSSLGASETDVTTARKRQKTSTSRNWATQRFKTVVSPKRAPLESSSISPTLNKENPMPSSQLVKTNVNCMPASYQPQPQFSQQPQAEYFQNPGYVCQVMYEPPQPTTSNYYVDQYGQPIKQNLPYTLPLPNPVQIPTYTENPAYALAPLPLEQLPMPYECNNDADDLEPFYRYFL